MWRGHPRPRLAGLLNSYVDINLGVLGIARPLVIDFEIGAVRALTTKLRVCRRPDLLPGLHHDLFHGPSLRREDRVVPGRDFPRHHAGRNSHRGLHARPDHEAVFPVLVALIIGVHSQNRAIAPVRNLRQQVLSDEAAPLLRNNSRARHLASIPGASLNAKHGETLVYGWIHFLSPCAIEPTVPSLLGFHRERIGSWWAGE